MKTRLLLLPCIIVGFLLSCNHTVKIELNPATAVNAVLGDISFVNKFSKSPDESVDYNTRIKTHLEYVEQKLRARKPDLTAEQLANRERMLDLLHEYRIAGQFPRNYDYEGNRPCFIDKDGNICAVGYLVEQTVGREVAEQINAKYKYEYLLNMQDETLENWIAGSGLTKEECAMIQPSYPTVETHTYGKADLSKRFQTNTAIVTTANVVFGSLNIMMISRGEQVKNLPFLGIVSGTTSILLGAYNLNRDLGAGYTTNHQRNLSIMNIGLGATSIFLSVMNVSRQNRMANRKDGLCYSVYPVSDIQNRQGLGFSLVKRF